jgi:hypothetical protein
MVERGEKRCSENVFDDWKLRYSVRHNPLTYRTINDFITIINNSKTYFPSFLHQIISKTNLKQNRFSGGRIGPTWPVLLIHVSFFSFLFVLPHSLHQIFPIFFWCKELINIAQTACWYNFVSIYAPNLGECCNESENVNKLNSNNIQLMDYLASKANSNNGM